MNFLSLYPLSFLEFLQAIGKDNLQNLLLQQRDHSPLPLVFHEDLLDLLKTYYLLGGMPEVVKEYSQSQNFEIAREIQKEIVAEVDFLMSHNENIFPLEVKSGTHQRTRSLAEYGKKYHPPFLSVTSPLNFYQKGDVRHYPLYAVSLFPTFA